MAVEVRNSSSLQKKELSKKQMSCVTKTMGLKR
jgi:hypothetical protein